MEKEFREIINGFKRYTEINTNHIFNSDYLSFDIEKLKFILVGDNPGQEERKYGRYLIGAAGRMARNFFREKIGAEFDKEVLVLNKSTFSTDKTLQLKSVYESEFANEFRENQIYMANFLFNIHKLKNVPVYIMGYSNYCKAGKWAFDDEKSGRVLAHYFKELHSLYSENPELAANLYFVKHFSMGRFHSDFKETEFEGTAIDKLNFIGKRNIEGFFQ